MKKTIFLFSALLGLFGSAHAQWQQLTMPIHFYSEYQVQNGKMFCGTNFSADGGITYQDRAAQLPMQDVKMLKIVGQTTYASFKESGTNQGKLYQSADYGQTWTLNTGYSNTPHAYTMDMNTHNGALYAMAETWQLFKSTDGGNSWTDATNAFGVIGPTFVDCGNITFGQSSVGIVQSADNGATWSESFPSVTTPGYAGVVDNNNGRVYTGGNHNLQSSNDCGGNWTNIYGSINSTVPGGYSVSALMHANGYEIAVTTDGVWYTQNGSNWSKLATPPTMTTVHQVAIDGDYLYCSDSNKLWRIKTNQIGTTGIAQTATFDGSVKISPNPASDKVQVAITLNKPEAVSLAIIDMQGRVVKAEAAQQMQVGQHSIDVSTAALAAGMYLLKVSDGHGSVNEKLVMQH